MRRKPRRYEGIKHETIGSDILSVVAAIPLAKNMLGEALYTKLAAVKPDGWYPVEWLFEASEVLDQKIGANGLRQVGRTLFRMSHEARFKEVAKTAADLIYALDDMYHHANRGTAIGGWKVVDFRSGYAVVDKTTPHHCLIEEGIVGQALLSIGIPVNIEQAQCFRQGADSCQFVLSSAVTDLWGNPR
jgi:hypothetical protein